MKLTLLALVALAGSQEPERLVQTLEDGRRVEREVLRDGDLVINDGAYLEFWPDGTPAVEGRFDDGLQVGRWKTWHPDGSLESEGAYRDGLRTGPWEVRGADGAAVASESGKFVILEPEFDTGERAARGETRDGVRHGSWRFYWESGALKAIGRYVEGAPDGPWSFYHPDGTLDPLWVTGIYVAGVRTEDTPKHLLEMFRVDAQATYAPRGIDHEARRDLDDLREGSGRSAQRAREKLAAGCEDPRYLSEVIAGLDFEAEPELAAELVEAELAPRWTWPMWAAAEPPLSSDELRLAALRESSALRVSTAAWRHIDYPPLAKEGLKSRSGGRLLPFAHPPLGDGSPDAFLAKVEGSWYAGRFEARRRSDRNEAIALALQWLVAHQSPEGFWDVAELGEVCDECDGGGEEAHNVGVTNLALLALMGDGHVPGRGQHSDAVARGLGWLLDQQDPRNGNIGRQLSHAWVYDQAIAALALSEGLFFHESPRLRMGVEGLVGLIHGMRNPFAGWRYDLKPTGDSDVSITAWMTIALCAAAEAGVELDRNVLWEVSAYLDKLTDEVNGRCGYDTKGSFSSRIQRVNDDYDPSMGEAMTAAALTVRYLIGQDAGASETGALSADLLGAAPPTWSLDPPGSDMYYWYYGSQACHQLGGKHWKQWDRALLEAALDHQHTDGHRAGSWDPVGPWGFAGGRVYATAMMTLSLEADRRLIPLREQ